MVSCSFVLRYNLNLKHGIGQFPNEDGSDDRLVSKRRSNTLRYLPLDAESPTRLVTEPIVKIVDHDDVDIKVSYINYGNVVAGLGSGAIEWPW